MRQYAIIAIAFAAGLAAGYALFANPRPAPPPPGSGPAWGIGTRFEVGVSDPTADHFERYALEVVRVIRADGSDEFGPDGRATAPRAEWRFTFPSATYFAVIRSGSP